MSDIFISYAREDRVLAEALAADLKSKGYQVWWDAELVGADDFYEVILEALNKAKAAIVIWTKASAKSRFVRDEARFALHLEKLIAVKDAALNPIDIPFGFQSQHTDDVGSFAQIVKALEKLGVKPAAAAAAVAPASLDRLQTAGLAEIAAFLGTNPPEAERAFAVARLKEIASAPAAVAKSESSLPGSIRMSNWQAFLSGLSFRVPGFQLSTQSTWTSLGVAFAYLLLIGAGFVFGATIDGRQPGLGTVSTFALLTWFAWRRFKAFALQQNLTASLVLGLAFIFMAAMLIFATVFGFVESTVILGEYMEEKKTIGGLLMLGGGLLAFILVIWKIRAAR